MKERLGKETAEKQIVMEVTNQDASNTDTIRLFKTASQPTNNNQSSLSNLWTSQDVPAAKFPLAGTITLTYNTSLTVGSLNPSSIDDMINDFNATLTENGRGILWYTYDVFTTNYTVYGASNLYDLVDMADAVDTFTFSESSASYISGTKSTVTIGVNGITYDELISDLNSQPYVLTTVYVKTNTATQLSRQLQMNYLQPNGTANIALAQPILSPDISQFVNKEVPLYFNTSALNDIQYVLEADQSVRFIFTYIHADLFDALSEIQKDNFGQYIESIREVDKDNANRIEETLYQQAWDQTNISNLERKLLAPEIEEPQPEYSWHVPLIYVVKDKMGEIYIKMI